MRPDTYYIKECILYVTTEDVSGHKLRRRHILEWSLGEDLTRHLSLRQLVEEAVFSHRIHLEGVS